MFKRSQHTNTRKKDWEINNQQSGDKFKMARWELVTTQQRPTAMLVSGAARCCLNVLHRDPAQMVDTWDNSQYMQTQIRMIYILFFNENLRFSATSAFWYSLFAVFCSNLWWACPWLWQPSMHFTSGYYYPQRVAWLSREFIKRKKIWNTHLVVCRRRIKDHLLLLKPSWWLLIQKAYFALCIFFCNFYDNKGSS